MCSDRRRKPVDPPQLSAESSGKVCRALSRSVSLVQLLREAFRIIDAGLFAEKRTIEIKPELIFAQEEQAPKRRQASLPLRTQPAAIPS